MKKGMDANTVADALLHNSVHARLLLQKYSDLRIVVEGRTIDYYSTIINREVDQFEFERNSVTTYVFLHTAYPYKNVKIDCPQCDGEIRVNANPSRIPLIMEHELIYNQDFSWYALAYEDILKSNDFNQATLAAIQLHIIKELEAKKGKKVDTFYLNNSIKRLLPFT